MIVDKSGSLASVRRHDYLPFGEELFAGTGGRTTAQGYSSSDGIRQHFISKERDTETGLDYFGARYFSSTQGRFTGVDPVGATKYHLLDPQLWNAYSYGLNNPLTIIDVDGRFPWTIFIRSFIFRSMLGVGGYGFRGDARGPSTDERATARIRMQFTLDYDRSQIPQDSIKSRSDTTTLVVPGGEISKEGVPRVQVGPVTVDNNGKSVEASYAGNNPLVPGAPDIDVGAKLTLSEDTAKGTLSITGQITGDKFPSTEAFVSDQSGNRVFLGAKFEEGDSLASKGRNLDNKAQLFKVDMKIRFDKNGNFKAVISGGKTYSIKAWNKKVEGEF
jgi:RHS repeat-associated protein